VEEFLRAREPLCVAVGARFLRRRRGEDEFFSLANTEGAVTALLLRHHRILFPVFSAGSQTPVSPALLRYLGREPVHAVQGLREDVEALEALLSARGIPWTDRIDYDLMARHGSPPPAIPPRGPPGLVFGRPDVFDMEELYYLQAAYEREEVLPRGAIFDPLSCRLSLGHIINQEQALVARLEGRMVGKINTSAASFTRCQIGGVFVHPDYRGRGIAGQMLAVFLETLAPSGKGLSLFVKKHNAAAQKLYRRAGFEPLGDYRICYY
jgi:GNAT superfamily N-acetyltransferase